MKNTTAAILIIIFGLSSHPAAAQAGLPMTHRWSSYNAIAGDHTVRSIQLSTGVRLEYVEQGDPSGVPVIFLHGLSDSWHSFETTLSFLPRNIHAFAITQRGHGNSSKPDSGYHPRNFAADIAAFIKQKKTGRVIIAGHSMGGVNAQQFALDFPELVKGVIIIDSGPSFRDNAGMPEFYQESLKLNGAIDKTFMHEFQKSTLAKPIDTAYYNLLVSEGMKVPASVFKAALKGLMEVDYSDDLEKIKAPVLIFWGEKDSFCNRDDQHTLASRIKNARLIVYEGTGHALHWEEPERFATDLVNFINKIIRSK